MTPKPFATLVMVLVLAGCGDPYVPTGPSWPEPPDPPPSNPPVTSTLHQFTESETGFSTTDLRDAQDEIVQFTTADELVWAADGTRLPGFRVSTYSGYSRGPVHFIEGKICTEGCAYLTVDYGHRNPGTLVDVEVAGTSLVVTQTTAYPSGTFTLSGIVTEVTSAGAVRPVAGAVVYRAVTSGWQEATTDATGSYRIHGLNDGTEAVSAMKDGYQTTEESVTVKGDTRFNIRLSRR